jgi:hypothetical protein
VFGWILAAVRRGIASNLARLEGAVQMALYNLVVNRIGRTRDRLTRLAERLKAGWVYCPKPPRKPPEDATEPPTDRPPRTVDKLTTGSQWLFRAAPGIDTAAAAAELRNLLAEPDISALFVAAPGPAWRIVRSICWMLGVEKPLVLGPSKPPKPGKPVYFPPPPLPWLVLPPSTDASNFHVVPRYYWPRVPIIRPKTT